MPLQEPPAAVVEPVRGSSRDLLAPGSELAWRVASLSRSERGRVGACARALLQGEARRGAGRRGAARRAAAARGRSFCPGEAWLARRAVMTQHAEKSLVSHRGGSEPKQATCRMTVDRRRLFFCDSQRDRNTKKTRPAHHVTPAADAKKATCSAQCMHLTRSQLSMGALPRLRAVLPRHGVQTERPTRRECGRESSRRSERLPR